MHEACAMGHVPLLSLSWSLILYPLHIVKVKIAQHSLSTMIWTSFTVQHTQAPAKLSRVNPLVHQSIVAAQLYGDHKLALRPGELQVCHGDSLHVFDAAAVFIEAPQNTPAVMIVAMCLLVLAPLFVPQPTSRLSAQPSLAASPNSFQTSPREALKWLPCHAIRWSPTMRGSEMWRPTPLMRRCVTCCPVMPLSLPYAQSFVPAYRHCLLPPLSLHTFWQERSREEEGIPR